MKNFFCIVLIIALSSCFFIYEKGIKVEVKNESNEKIINLEISTSERLKTINTKEIAPNETLSEFLSMKDNVTDGEYILRFTRASGKMDTIKCGYYTNGKNMEMKVAFVVRKDTTLVSFSEYGY